MKTILIPLDFTENASNVARYGVDFANYVKAEKIILYHSYSVEPLPGDISFSSGMATPDLAGPVFQAGELEKISIDGLEKQKADLLSYAQTDIPVELVSEMGPIGQTIDELAVEKGADLIVIGISEATTFERLFFGSTALTVVNNTLIPVLIVPPGSHFTAIQNIGWACDCKNVEETTPMHTIENLLSITNASLHVIHNEPNQEAFNESVIQQNKKIQDFLKNDSYKFALLENKNLTEAVNTYVDQNGINLLIVVPKKHSWLETIFSKSSTKELAFHTHVPLLCLQQ